MKRIILTALCGMLLSTPCLAKTQADYKAMVYQNKNATIVKKLKAVNEFYNDFDYNPVDEEVKWKTPRDFLSDKSGETVDFATAKFFALKDLGVNPNHMKIIYGYMDGFSEPVMLLTVTDKNKKKYVLDNFENDINLLKQRNDIEVIYSFDEKYIWTIEGYSGSSQQIKQWRELLKRMK